MDVKRYSGSVLIIGDEKWKWNAEYDWAYGFQTLGWYSTVLDERTPSQKLLNAAKKNDLILFISSGRNTDRSLMKKLRSECLTTSWHADLFWGLERQGWKDNRMWQAEFVFTADGNNESSWAQMGVNHHWMLPAVRDRWTEEKGSFNPLYACDLAFVGNNGSNYHPQWPYREKLLGALQRVARRNKLAFRNPGGAEAKIERDISMSNFYASAKVTVGDSLCFKKKDSLYWSDRVYEATGRGGVLVMPQIDALQKQFPMLPMYEWGDWKGLEEIVLDLLNDDKKRASIARRCHLITSQNHTYSKRAEVLLETVGKEAS